jgi:hypothetical protein
MIADNFIYGLDLVQCCKIRKKKAIVLKLNFCKAFDTVLILPFLNIPYKGI